MLIWIFLHNYIVINNYYGFFMFTEVNNNIFEWNRSGNELWMSLLWLWWNSSCFNLQRNQEKIIKRSLCATHFHISRLHWKLNNKSYLISFNLLLVVLHLCPHKRYIILSYIELPFYNNFVKNIIFHKSNHKEKVLNNRTIFILKFCYDRPKKKIFGQIFI